MSGTGVRFGGHEVDIEALRRSELKHRRLHENRIDAFVSVDMSGRIVEFNEAYRAMLGYESDELLGLTYQQLTPSRWHGFEAEIIAREVLPRGHSRVYEKEYERKDGTVLPVELRTILIRDEGAEPTGMWAVVRDISDRKQAEAALRESESWLSSAVEIASIGRYSQTGPSDDRSTFLDDRARRLLDIPPDQEPRTHSYWIEHIHPADLIRVADVSARFEGGGPARAAVEYRYRRRSDDIVWIRHVAEALERDASGRAVRVVGILQDVTDQKLAEDALHNLSKRLIGAHEEERARVSRELHDGLSQSLALIAIKLDLLRQSAPATGRAYRRNITEILETVNHLSTDVHRISRDLHPMRLEQQGLEAAIRGLCRELLSARSTAVEYELRDIPRDLPWDVALCLYRVLQEALHNVLKHSRATAVKVSAWRDGAELRLAVADNGVGFSPAAPRIAVSAGLANMRVRVSSVAGRIRLESSPGKGTRIDVAVPVAELVAGPGGR